MNITFLGTGTSVGVPSIGCRCDVCRSPDARNRRRRASLYVVAGGTHLVIDTAPDFREQVLTCGVARIDALLYTHAHADHVVGFDDIRRFNEIQNAEIPVYGAAETLADLERMFPYIRQRASPGLSYPRVRLEAVSSPFMIGAVRVEPLPVEHACIATYGYRLEAAGRVLAYVPDCHAMEDAVLRRLTGVDVMILDALRPTPHPTHYGLDESLAMLKRLGATRSFITHLGHHLEHVRTQIALPAGVEVPYDGLVVEL